MDWRYFLLSVYFATVAADIRRVHTLNAQQDARIRLECSITSKQDAEEAMWIRIRPPHNPDMLTYRDSVVYAPDRIELEQRRLSSILDSNGTSIDTYYLNLALLRPTIADEGRYICSKHPTIFAEYDLYIIIPPQFIDNNTFHQQRSVVEGSTLHLSCSAYGRPQPSITWFYRTTNDKHIQCDGVGCLDRVCEIHRPNFTRDDPSVVECIADNYRSSRISKVFTIDVLYPPKITTTVRKLVGPKYTDVFLECLSIANPAPSFMWLDDHRQEVADDHLYTIRQENQTSILSFSTSATEPSKVIYYCQSNNSIGTMEKSFDVSDLMKADATFTLSASVKPARSRSRTTTTMKTTTTTVSIMTAPLNTSVSCCSNRLFLIFILCTFLKNTIYCTV